jgi:hypothetical protein
VTSARRTGIVYQRGECGFENIFLAYTTWPPPAAS